MCAHLTRKFLYLLGLAALTLTLTGTPAAAAARTARSAAMPAAQPAGQACAVLLTDVSGSMADNDPAFLRNTGARLFIALLDDGDQVGLVRFSTTASALTPQLVPLTSPGDKRALMARLTDDPPSGYTDLRAGLRSAAELLHAGHCPAAYLVLLSDGQPELSGGLPAGYADDTLALARQLNAPILAIALTPSAEYGLLYRLAAATSPPGVVIPAHSAADLLDAYLAVLAHLKDRTVIGQGVSAAPGRPELPLDAGLAPYVTRITYVVGKPAAVQAALMAPGDVPLLPGDPRLAFAYTDDPRFSVFTIDTPAPGAWAFDLSGTGTVQARALLRSRLRITLAAPAAYQPLGEPLPIAASLREEQPDGGAVALIGEAAFWVLVTRPDGAQEIIDRLYDDGTHGDALAGDGVYSSVYVRTDMTGTYRLDLTGYKGVVPVAHVAQTEVVAFPQLEVLSPSAPGFDFRGQPLDLRACLAGGEPPSLDTGAFVTLITRPDGQVARLPLAQDGECFTARYAPTLEGAYHLAFVPEDATYKGAPYHLQVTRTIAVRLIPTLAPATDRLEIGAVETGALATGLSIPVDFTSSSPRSEPVTLTLVAPAGLQLTSASPAAIPTGGGRVHLTLQGSLAPAVYTATLVLSARDGLDLPVREFQVVFRAVQPALFIEPATIEVSALREDQAAAGIDVTLAVTSTTLQTDTVTFQWIGDERIVLDAPPVSLAAGGHTTVAVRLRGPELVPGRYAGRIAVAGRAGVQHVPEAVAVTVIVVPVPWCVRWCAPLGGGGILLLVIGAVAASYLGSRPRPWGTLVSVKAPVGQPPASISLASAAGRLGTAVVLGSRRGARPRLTGPQVRPRHAAIRAMRQTVVERMGKPPRAVRLTKTVNVIENLSDGLVRVNTAPVPRGQRSAPLCNGNTVTIGDYQFVYRE